MFACLLFKTIKLNVYRIIILPLVLYGYETESLTVREEHGLMGFTKRVLRKIFGCEREEVTGGWRNFCIEGHHDVYFSLNITGMIKSRRMKWQGMCHESEREDMPTNFYKKT
jgi:hypothetical protein